MISLSEGHRGKSHYRENIMIRDSKRQADVRTVETSFSAEGEGPLTKDLKVYKAGQNGKMAIDIESQIT